jgi:hypothetical protein
VQSAFACYFKLILYIITAYDNKIIPSISNGSRDFSVVVVSDSEKNIQRKYYKTLFILYLLDTFHLTLYYDDHVRINAVQSRNLYKMRHIPSPMAHMRKNAVMYFIEVKT